MPRLCLCFDNSDDPWKYAHLGAHTPRPPGHCVLKNTVFRLSDKRRVIANGRRLRGKMNVLSDNRLHTAATRWVPGRKLSKTRWVVYTTRMVAGEGAGPEVFFTPTSNSRLWIKSNGRRYNQKSLCNASIQCLLVQFFFIRFLRICGPEERGGGRENYLRARKFFVNNYKFVFSVVIFKRSIKRHLYQPRSSIPNKVT